MVVSYTAAMQTAGLLFPQHIYTQEHIVNYL